MEFIKLVLKWIASELCYVVDIRTNTLVKITLLIAGMGPVVCWITDPTNKQYVYMTLLMWIVISVAATYMHITEYYEEQDALLLEEIQVVQIKIEEVKERQKNIKRYPEVNPYYEEIKKEVESHEKKEMH